MNKQPATILIVDDHTLLRSGISLMLKEENLYAVVGEAPNAMAAIALTEELKPNLILLDLNLPGLNGLEAIPTLLQKSPESKILVLTMHDDPDYLRRALKTGASGYILKKAAESELMHAIEAALNDEIYIHPSMTQSLVEDLVPSSKQETGDKWNGLSKREQQVMRLVALGNTSAEISEKLAISNKTVDTYRARGYTKLGLKSRAQLVKYAMDKGLLD